MQLKESNNKQIISIASSVLLLTLILAGCSTTVSDATPTATILPTQTPEPTATPTATTPPEFLPENQPDWDDRSIYRAGLRPTMRHLLRENLQASVYHITLNIPEELPSPLDGTLMVRYFNQESEPLEEIYFRLFAYIYGGQLETENVRMNGSLVPTELESENTALKISLTEPLLVGESVVISMNFTLHLPVSLAGSYGLLGYFDETLTLDTFYPIIPTYDDDGWYTHTPYLNGDATYQDISYYVVDVNAPEDFALASTGVEIERTTEEEIQHIKFAAGPVRDFYIAGSRGFKSMTKVVNGITINSYAQTGQLKGQTVALDSTANALMIFSEMFGSYPYTEFDIVNAPMLAYGIEYPGITNIYNELYNTEDSESGDNILKILEMVIAHEVGHQWFYNMVGNDQQDEPWLDESVTQYITYLYMLEQNGEKAAQININNWEARLRAVENPDKAVGLSARFYQSSEYSGIVYGRGPLFFLNLQKAYGKNIVIEGLRDYYQTNIWQIGQEEKLRASLEAACECDLTEEFEDFIYPP